MRILYVNNFRGFQGTYIPIRDVNFLVGENSTGKTSILSLINLLQSPHFWLSQEFNNEEVELGNYKDIVSAHGNRTGSFEIGIIDLAPKTESSQDTIMFLMSFKEERGRPRIRNFNFNLEDTLIEMIVGRKTVRYRTQDLPGLCSDKNVLTVFENWTSQLNKNRKGYKQIPLEDFPFRRGPLLPYLRGIMKSLILDQEDEVSPFSLEVVIPSFTRNLTWLAPIRNKPQRTYDSSFKSTFTPEGAHVPYLVRDLLDRKINSESFVQFVHDFGEDSGLYDGIYTHNFGRQVTSPFELGVTIDGARLRIGEVGYGVSQSLPVLVEIYARSPDTWFAIQQPEVHLHPKAQAALGNLIWEAAQNEDKRFLIETHSDYLIDRYRILCRDSVKANPEGKQLDAQVLFFERNKGFNTVYSIEIQPTGDYAESQPESFREFFLLEQISLLGL